MSRAALLAEVRRLRAGLERREVALEHAGRAIVTLRRGIDALQAQNRELTLEAQREIRPGRRRLDATEPEDDRRVPVA
jgi:hypothetical protein